MEIMAEMQGDISGVVKNTVIETFNGMLGQNVITAAVQKPAIPGPLHRIYACLLLDQKTGVSANFSFTFDEELLTQTAAAFYSVAQAAEPAVRDDIACAVANIVGSKVKTCMNKYGYAFEMSVPFVAKAGDAPPVAAPNSIHVHFSYDDTKGRVSDDAVVVNLLLEGHQAGNC